MEHIQNLVQANLHNPAGEPGYDGLQSDWVNEIILLDQLNGAIITGFRFIQTSDNFVEGDGFTIDDFSISGFPNWIDGGL